MNDKQKYKKLIVVSLIFALIFLTACSREKNVKSKQFDLLKKEILSNGKVCEIQIKFLRPSLYINFITSEDFKIEDMKKIIDKLKPVINEKHMDDIANKYWVKDAKISNVYIHFYNGKIDKNDTRKNLIYSVFTKYYKTYIAEDNPIYINAYSTWFIEVSGKEYKLQDYFDVNH